MNANISIDCGGPEEYKGKKPDKNILNFFQETKKIMIKSKYILVIIIIMI